MELTLYYANAKMTSKKKSSCWSCSTWQNSHVFRAYTILVKFVGNKPLPLWLLKPPWSMLSQIEWCPQEPKWPHLGADLSIWLFWIEKQDAKQLCHAAKAVLDILTPWKMAGLAWRYDGLFSIERPVVHCGYDYVIKPFYLF